MHRQRSTPVDRNLAVAAFRMAPPENVLNYHFNGHPMGPAENAHYTEENNDHLWDRLKSTKSLINKYQRELQPHRSLTEHQYPLDDSLSKAKLKAEVENKTIPAGIKQPSVLIWPLMLATRYLESHSNCFWVSFKHGLRWRELTLQIPQDLLICSLKAFYQVKTTHIAFRLPSFDWPTKLPVYHQLIWTELSSRKKHLADNHAHYIAGPDPVMPAWISLMNKMTDRNADLKKVKLDSFNLNATVSYEPGFKIFNWEQRLTIAACIRWYLFNWLKYHKQGEKFKEKLIGLNGLVERAYRASQADTRIVNNFADEIFNTSDILLQEIQQELKDDIDLYSFSNDLLRFKPDTENRPLDYLISAELFFENEICERRGEEWLHIGERDLWTKIFKSYYCQDPCFKEIHNLVIAYFQLFTQFRAELIQSNPVVGFENFYEYQSRKEDLLETDKVMQSIRKGLWLHSRLSGKNKQILKLKYQNAKIGPNKPNITTFADSIGVFAQDLDTAAYVGVNPEIERERNLKEIRSRQSGDPLDRKIKKRIGTNAHFIKVKDKFVERFENGRAPNPLDDLLPECRHYETRRTVEDQCRSIANWINYANAEELSLWRGPDAASNELYTRIEVYAQAMRFLRNAQPHPFYANELLCSFQQKVHSHAGEEINDIIDGLRYVDECIRFQELRSGDPIGHGLALGLDPELFYEKKGYRTDLHAQDYIDNLAWTLSMAHRLNVNMSNRLSNHLLSEFQRVYSEVYQGVNVNIDPEKYFLAWKLRGDNPKLYEPSQPGNHNHLRNAYAFKDWEYYHEYRLEEHDQSIRSHPEIYKLVHNYHFNNDVKRRGLVMHHLKIEPELIDLIRNLQSAMGDKVANLGLVIETLPSINLLISPIRRYDQHPLLKFSPLPSDKDFDKQLLQQTSVNTDNPGVCNISIENEYTLLYIALQKQLDHNSQRKHTDAEIQSWIRNLIDTAKQQSSRH